LFLAEEWAKAFFFGAALEAADPSSAAMARLIRSRSFFNSATIRLREECLNEHVFVSLDDARRKIEKWRIEYNWERPHSSLGHLTPEEFAFGCARFAEFAAEYGVADSQDRV